MARTAVEEPSKPVCVKVQDAMVGAIGRITSLNYKGLLPSWTSSSSWSSKATNLWLEEYQEGAPND